MSDSDEKTIIDSARKMDKFIGKIFTRIEKVYVYNYVGGGDTNGNELRFVQANGDFIRMYHEQDCCENVWLEDICGDLDDLVGKPITGAEEVTSRSDELPKERNFVDDSHTWTFYKLRTSVGEVTFRWYGTSNGYYSESVDIVEVSAGCSSVA